MGVFFKKFVSAFSYGSGFVLAIVCAVYAVNQFSTNSLQVASNVGADSKSSRDNLEAIEVINISKLSNFTNYASEGRKEEFIFTGELKNNSNDLIFEKLVVEIDLYDSENKFIYKCGGWDGSGKKVMPQMTITFQKICHNMPTEIAKRYDSHRVVVQQRKL